MKVQPNRDSLLPTAVWTAGGNGVRALGQCSEVSCVLVVMPSASHHWVQYVEGVAHVLLLWHGTDEEAAGVAATDHDPRAQVREGCSGGMCAAVAGAAAVPALSQQHQQQPE